MIAIKIGDINSSIFCISFLKTKIVKQLDYLPDNALKQVADFIEFLAWRNSTNKNLKTDLSNLRDYELYEWQSGESEQGTSVDNVLLAEPQVYKVGNALVVRSIPVGDIEASIDKARDERINEIIADYESSV